MPDKVEELIDRVRSGDRIMLGRAITLVESSRPDHRRQAEELIERCLPHSGHSLRIGITGVPGVGKSTFIESFGSWLIDKQGRQLAVLAIDPSSHRARGSILGDKTRMPTLATNSRAFIRPSPSVDNIGGVARYTRETIILCEAAGYDTILVETIGVGQAETVVHSMVDYFLLLLLAGAGDMLQGIKRGIMEMANAVVITKADGDNVERAERARSEYEAALAFFPVGPAGLRPQVLTVSAVKGIGLAQVWQNIESYLQFTRHNGYFERCRREQARYWMYESIRQQLLADFNADQNVAANCGSIEEEVLSGRMNPFAASQKLLQIYHQGKNQQK